MSSLFHPQLAHCLTNSCPGLHTCTSPKNSCCKNLLVSSSEDVRKSSLNAESSYKVYVSITL